MVRPLLKGPGETGCQEHHDVQQKQMQSPVWEEEWRHALQQAVVGTELWRVGSEGSDGTKLDEAAVSMHEEGGVSKLGW